MGGRWRTSKIKLVIFPLLALLVELQLSCSLNLEGLALLQFRGAVDFDPYGSFGNWNHGDADPCMWSGVQCLDGEVVMLKLEGKSLRGGLDPALGDLSHLRSLVLSKNQFFGTIPKKLGQLSMLEVLDLRDNNLSGIIPPEIGELQSLKHLLLSDNYFEGGDQSQIGNHPMIQPVHAMVYSSRRTLSEQSSNLAAAPVNGDYVFALPSSRSSGAFPAVPEELSSSDPPSSQPPPTFNEWPSNGPSNHNPTDGKSDPRWKYVVGISSGVFLLIVSVVVLAICWTRAAKTIGPWKTGLSGQLQKAFVTGVPKLNRVELEQACEDFSNIISTHEAYSTYKGTLSNGVEITVASTAITSLAAWKKRSEAAYRKKIASLSRVNYKNFVNLIGYLEENEPFARMMVFEYAPNGTLFEHLHVQEAEHLDWSARMRIIMGIAYCLQYMHELKPPLPHSHLISHAIHLSEDYAAKVAEISFWSEFMSHSKKTDENDSELPMLADAETNVYDFGLLLLEVISGKLRNSEEHGPIGTWAEQYLHNKQSISFLIDPALESFKDNELEVICEVIKECIQPDVRKRPTIQEVIADLTRALHISPDAAMPRHSALWWAELEILSAEAP